MNTMDKAQLQECADKLVEQRPLVQQYVMDQIYSTMENEEAYIAAYYAGDCMLMMQNVHIGEVQVSLWDPETIRICQEKGVRLL